MKRGWLIPLALFTVILIHGSLIGLTDDEAYYWVLAQRPALGYAFHPPAVAWVIALAQWIFGGIFGHHSPGLVRLPAALCAAGMVALGTRWIARAGGGERAYSRGAYALVAVAGIFALSWMMVPDLPLFLGWTLAFVATWEICFSAEEIPAANYFFLSAGLALAILSKFSGVLAAISSGLCIALWSPPQRRLKGLASVAVGGLVASAPILWWNAHHEWGSILYQIKERHGGAQISLVRYLRFWTVETLLAGPALLIFGIGLAGRWLRRRAERAESYVMLWILPGAAIFFTQPLWTDFKPHWALIVWWPLALALGWSWARGGVPRLARTHLVYGAVISGAVLLACHYPIQSRVMACFRSVPIDPRLDVTNDLYGWSELRSFIAEKSGAEGLKVPIVGSRYQTASQAAFAMGDGAAVTLLPRDQKAMDEWPNLRVSDGEGPTWPRLTQSVFYVGDNRYDGGPEYPDADCRKQWIFEKMRSGYAAKTIIIWRCVPGSSRP